MSDSKRTVQITLPNWEWKDLCRWRNLFLLLAFLGFAWSAYWWKMIRPYESLGGAVLQMQTREIFSQSEGNLPESFLDEGDFFSKGQPLFSFADALLPAQLRLLEEKVRALQQELQQEKNKLDQNMQQYVYLQNELEAEIGPTELTVQILQQIQQQQEKIIRMEQELSGLEPDQAALCHTIEKQRIVAPFEGIVLRRFKQVGEKALIGDPLLLICNREKRWVEADASEALVGKIRLGLPAKIQFSSFPGKVWVGKVSWISPIAISGKIKIRMVAEDLPLHVGLTGKAAIKIY